MEKERNIIKCPICNEEKITKIQKIENFTLYKCLTCKLEFFWPLLFEKDQYDQYYTDGYGKEIIMKLKKFSKFQILLPLHKTYKFVLKMLIKKFPKNSVVFDIGCGTGEFLWRVYRAGFIPIGCDISKIAVTFCNKNYNFKVFYGSFENYPASYPQPDVITLFEVLEHQADPLEFLISIKGKFPDATLCLSVPSPDRFTKYIYNIQKEDWDYPPYHLTHWNKKALKYVLKKAGYKKVSVYSFTPNFFMFLWIYSNYFHTGILNSIFKKKSEVIITNFKIEKKSELNCKKILFGLTLFKMIILFPIILIKYIKIFDKTIDIRLLAGA